MNVQSCVGYRVGFVTRGVELCKSPDVEIGQDAGGVFNRATNENGGVGGKKREWRCRREEKRMKVEAGRRDIYTRVPAI